MLVFALSGMIKSTAHLYSNVTFHVAVAKIIRDKKTGQHACNTWAKLPYQNEKQGLGSGFFQQLSLSVSAAGVDLAPLVEAGGGRGEHN